MAGAANTQFAVAVHVLGYLALAGKGRQVASDELAASTNTNPVHVRRVLGPLREAGLLTSRPGAGGGWELARAAESIGLVEVWRLVTREEPVIAVHACAPACPVGQAITGELEQLNEQAAAAIEAGLAGVTVAELVARAGCTLAPASADRLGPRATRLA